MIETESETYKSEVYGHNSGRHAFRKSDSIICNNTPSLVNCFLFGDCVVVVQASFMSEHIIRRGPQTS